MSPERKAELLADAKAAVGRYVRIEFGVGSQIAYVHKVTAAGNVQVTGYNASRGEWYRNKRTIEPRAILPQQRGYDNGPWANPPDHAPDGWWL